MNTDTTTATPEGAKQTLSPSELVAVFASGAGTMADLVDYLEERSTTTLATAERYMRDAQFARSIGSTAMADEALASAGAAIEQTRMYVRLFERAVAARTAKGAQA